MGPLRSPFASRDFREGFAEMLPACVGLIPFGLVCGVGAAAAGVDFLGALGMSVIIFSGAAQIVVLQLYAEGAPVAVVVLTCFVVGLRFLMYSAAMAPYLGRCRRTGATGSAFLLTDQAFAASVRRFSDAHDPRGGALHFLGGGSALWLMWQLTNAIGYLAGNVIPASWSLEFAVPLCFIALVAPVLREMPAIVAAVTAGAFVLALVALPMKLNLIVAGVIGILAGTLADLARERWKAH